MIYLIYFLIMASTGLLIVSLSSRPDTASLNIPVYKKEATLDKPKPQEKSFLGVVGSIGRIFLKYIQTDKLQKNLLTAKINLKALEFLGLKQLSCLAAIVLAYMFLRQRFSLAILIPLAAVAGFFLPDVWLRTRLNKYKDEILRALPDAIDLLSLCVGAGLDFMLAVKWIVDKSKSNPLIDELKAVLNEIKVGKSRKDALNDMATRLDMPDVSTFARTLIQADKMGVSVADALRMLSEDARAQRFRRGERIALKAPIKMLVPLIFFILPTVGIIVGAPVILKFMQAGINF